MPPTYAPGWFDDAEFPAVADSLANPDWVPIMFNACRSHFLEARHATGVTNICYSNLAKRESLAANGHGAWRWPPAGAGRFDAGGRADEGERDAEHERNAGRRGPGAVPQGLRGQPRLPAGPERGDPGHRRRRGHQ